MPRPKKVATHDYEIEHDYIVNTDVNSELISDLEAKKEFDSIVESIAEEIPEPVVQASIEETESVRQYNVYDKSVLVDLVFDNSEKLQEYLAKNKLQLDNFISTLCLQTNNEEDLVLFNVSPFDNRTYKTLAQYYIQNGLAPKPPVVSDWMTYYKSKYSLATEEEIAITVFGPLDYSFELKDWYVLWFQSQIWDCACQAHI